MPLNAGARVGAFEIVGALGAGGMGEVYRARDTRLGRDVALKLLPNTFSQDPERVARFQREAQLLAALNHPHIAAIYGFEEIAGSHCLVLELVEGETLAARLTRGRLAWAEALPIAREVVDGAEAAHERGIIHRDLKPSNIALTRDGRVKVLDFGLAKAMDPVALSGDPAALGASHSPTFTMAATQAGVILGTAAYMSPEQAKGRAADKRSDVWAFGCVLFEMLAGTRAFEGEDVSDTMAAVLRAEPAWTALPGDIPAGVRSLLQRCLDKDRRTRIPDMSVIRYLLDDAGSGATAHVSRPAPAYRPRAAWAVAALAVVALTAVVLVWAPWRGAPEPGPLRLLANLGTEATVTNTLGAAATLSPDGRTIAFVAVAATAEAPVPGNPRTTLYVRRLDQLEATRLPGTEGAIAPFFSPDGQWVAFFAGGKVKKVSVNGGAAVTLADAPNPRGGAWAADDTIIFAPGTLGALQRVSGAGGAVAPATTLAEGESNHRWPESLPGGRVLYTAGTGAGFSPEGASLVIRDPDGTARILLRGGYYGRYASSGHIVYAANGTLFAVTFDADTGELTGQGVPILETIASNTGTGTAQIALSASGTAVYLPGEALNDDAPISWLHQSGTIEPLRATAANWSSPEFSPDGTRLAMDIWDGSQEDIWVYEWARDTLSRLTFDPGDDHRPFWTPDGRRIAFSSRRGGKGVRNLYWQRADGTGEVQQLTDSSNDQVGSSFHPTGKFLAYDEIGAGSARDIWILPLEGDETKGWKPGQPTVFLRTPQLEGSPMFSRDGRWIAYISNETGRNEVYVRPFPGPGGKWQISTGIADDPTWSPNGRELMFLSATDLRVLTAPFSVEGESFRAEKPRFWSKESRLATRPRAPSRDWALHPDGRRFAVAVSAESEAAAPANQMVFVFNFFDELRRVAKPAR